MPHTNEEKVEVTEHANGSIKANGIEIFPPHTKEIEEKIRASITLWKPVFYNLPPTKADIEDLLKTDIMPLISDLKKSIREEIESMQERCEECENGEIHDTNPKNIIIDEILSLKSLE